MLNKNIWKLLFVFITKRSTVSGSILAYTDVLLARHGSRVTRHASRTGCEMGKRTSAYLESIQGRVVTEDLQNKLQ